MNAEFPAGIPAACARVRARLDEALDATLEPLAAARDAGHLEACAACAAEARRRADWLAHVRAALAPPAREQRDADARVTVALDGARLRPLRRAPRFAAAALLAAAALALLAALPAILGGDAAVRAWTSASLVDLVPSDLPAPRWNPGAIDPWTVR